MQPREVLGEGPDMLVGYRQARSKAPRMASNAAGSCFMRNS